MRFRPLCKVSALFAMHFTTPSVLSVLFSFNLLLFIDLRGGFTAAGGCGRPDDASYIDRRAVRRGYFAGNALSDDDDDDWRSVAFVDASRTRRLNPIILARGRKTRSAPD